MKKEFQLLDRREFVADAIKSVALLATFSSAASSATEKAASNPFAYDLSRLEKTDPKLISHVEIKRWRAPHDEARRLALSPTGRLFIASGNYVTEFTSDGERGMEIA
ncbi:MAG: hypothetical protein HOP33_03895, partial [Verrucomicrobia bacterium]|nr:hypothetical protein [Verrucomicrobiota bacterium]